MEVNVHILKNGLPIVIFDDYYSEKQTKLITREIDFLSGNNKLLGPSQTGSAARPTEDGIKLKKQNKGLFLDEAYFDRNISDILNINRKIFDLEIVNNLIEISPVFRWLKEVNYDSTLLSYYEDSDYYESHVDSCVLTVLSYFFDTPKKFTGGDITFEGEVTIPCEFNRTIIFPSILMHEVSPIEIPDEFKNKNYGRYAITQLLSFRGD